MPAKRCLLPFLSLILLFGHPAKADQQSDLNFKIQSGPTANHFFRQGSMSAHLSVRSGQRPRVIVAFPAGNSGAGLWFEDAPDGLRLETTGDPHAIESAPYHGIKVVIRGAAKKLTIKRAMLGSIRFLRQVEEDSKPPELKVELTKDGNGALLHRKSLDLVHDYQMILRPLAGTTLDMNLKNDSLSFLPRPGTLDLSFELTAMTSEQQLTPIAFSKLFQKLPTTPQGLEMAHALAFLSYQEKLLAGSWRFLTYFGRDTLLSVYLLRPVLGAAVYEAALASVLSRLAPDGRVAHEEDIGDWAAYRRQLSHHAATPPLTDPIYDYKMVDADFLLPTVAASYILDPNHSSARIKAFLQRQTPTGSTFKSALLANMRLVLAEASPYAKSPIFSNLIHLRQGEIVGDWRDSGEGLGGGIFPYGVNVAFVPAALGAVQRLLRSEWFSDPPVETKGSAGIRGGIIKESSALLAAQAQQMATVWSRAAEHFQVRMDHDSSGLALNAFSQNFGLGPVANSLPPEGRRFHGLALAQNGDPIAVMHTDEGFNLLFNEPPAADLTEAMELLRQPFPMGLMTPVGLVVANPAFTRGASLWKRFTRSHYHGTVIWSWQQAVYLAGLRRQALRPDLGDGLRRELRTAAEHLALVAADAPSHGREELWTFRIERGRYRTVPFGADLADHSEANPVQLWSTVFLGL